MDPANVREAMHEMELDLEEGADMLMVKPAMPYLDLIRQARDRFPVPIGAYQVSGEFSMIMAAVEQRMARSGSRHDGIAHLHPPRRSRYHPHLFRQGCRPCAGVSAAGSRGLARWPLPGADGVAERTAVFHQRLHASARHCAIPPWRSQVARSVGEVDAILGEAPSPDREAMRIKQYIDFGVHRFLCRPCLW